MQPMEMSVNEYRMNITPGAWCISQHGLAIMASVLLWCIKKSYAYWEQLSYAQDGVGRNYLSS